MATLYAYPLGTPKTNDLIIGTSVPLPQLITTDEQSTTVNFTVASIIAMVTTATGAQSFQQVTNIDQTTIGADLVSVTTNNVQITGILYDSANAKGTVGQVLTASALGKTVWATDTSGVTSLTTTDGTWIDLTPNAPATGAVTVTADLSAPDGSAVAGTRFLSKDNTWAVPIKVDTFTNANGTFISAGTVNTAATGAVTMGAIDLRATGTPSATTFLSGSGNGVWAVPTGTIASLTTTGTSGVSTLVAGVLNIPNYTYTEVDTLATVTARGASTATASTFSGGLTSNGILTCSGTGADAYSYFTGNGGGTIPPNTFVHGMTQVWNNSAGSREWETYWATGADIEDDPPVTATGYANNKASYMSWINRYAGASTSGTPEDTIMAKWYGNGEFQLLPLSGAAWGAGTTPTFSTPYIKLPTAAGPINSLVKRTSGGAPVVDTEFTETLSYNETNATLAILPSTSIESKIQMKSADGTTFTLTVSNAGALVIT